MREAKGKFALGTFLRKHLLYAMAIALVILSLLFVSLYLLLSYLSSASKSSSGLDDRGFSAREGRQLAAELSSDFAPLPLDPDELFPPEEPDFLPRVLLSREPRSEWNLEDAAPFWTDPTTLDGPALRTESKLRIDSLMETIP